MKKLVVFLFFFSSLCLFMLAQLPVNKPVKILFATDKNQCLQKSDSLQLTLSLYKEKPNQEWKIIPTDEPNFYYLQTTDSYYLIDFGLANLCRFKKDFEQSDNYKFSIIPNKGLGGWDIAPKNRSIFFLQPSNNSPLVYLLPKTEFSTTAFIIDTVPYRRPTPSFISLEKSMCDAGVLKDLNPVSLYGADATCYQPGGMYPAQFIIRVYLSADKSNRIEILIYDDVRRLKNKTYKIQPKGLKNQPSIKLFFDDKPYEILNQADIKLEMLVLKNNTFKLLVSEATKTQNEPSITLFPTYDIAVKGIYILQ